MLKLKIIDFNRCFYEIRGNFVISVNFVILLYNLLNLFVDYIFIDLFFGVNIMYFELNLIWEGWLKVIINNKEEVIINKE